MLEELEGAELAEGVGEVEQVDEGDDDVQGAEGGVLAQEVETVFVAAADDGVDEEEYGGGGYVSV